MRDAHKWGVGGWLGLELWWSSGFQWVEWESFDINREWWLARVWSTSCYPFIFTPQRPLALVSRPLLQPQRWSAPPGPWLWIFLGRTSWVPGTTRSVTPGARRRTDGCFLWQSRRNWIGRRWARIFPTGIPRCATAVTADSAMKPKSDGPSFRTRKFWS
jgi:hypothetical protein